MFSIQQFLSKGKRFQQLLEAATQESHECVRLVIKLMNSPQLKEDLDGLVLARRREKKISDNISSELAHGFITGLEREDIEALARALSRIPKAAEKLGERLVMAQKHLVEIDFSRQADMLAKAMDAVQGLVQQLRDMANLEQMKSLNEHLQMIEVEADQHMLKLLGDLYNGKYEPLQTMVLREVYELIEKVVDRCHNVGNVVMNIVLKNS